MRKTAAGPAMDSSGQNKSQTTVKTYRIDGRDSSYCGFPSCIASATPNLGAIQIKSEVAAGPQYDINVRSPSIRSKAA
jgi:hypothetical protein